MRILVIFGTRPEAIKMAPVIRFLRTRPDDFDVRVCVTAQHREMLDSVLNLFEIHPEYDLGLMRPNQDLSGLTARALSALSEVYAEFRPDRILVHGDTTTTFVAALAAFYQKIPVGHIEAGLRTWNLDSPWPEEFNRQATGTIADLHFAPTEQARMNLQFERVADSTIHVTGNTAIDALLETAQRIDTSPEIRRNLDMQFKFLNSSRRMILVTGHRRENFGAGMDGICYAIRDLVQAYADVDVVYPVHLNPNVQEPVKRILGSMLSERVHLIPPVDYLPFVYLMGRAYFILSDSGGVQEEAPSLGRPVLVMRETTERPEGVQAGCSRLVGARREKIVLEASRLLDDRNAHAAMAMKRNPYGDGLAAARIAKILAVEQSCSPRFRARPPKSREVISGSGLSIPFLSEMNASRSTNS